MNAMTDVEVQDGGLQMRKSRKRPREIIAVSFEEHKYCCRCTECGKRFGSPKALYGHMRCHPERWWRGINPPVRKRAEHSGHVVAADDDREVADSLLMLSNGCVVNSEILVSTDCGFLDLNSPAPVEQLPCSGCSSLGLNLELRLS